ncbi:MAG: hypothetical protein B7Z15_08180 [Rhizobiales bacterium 32-66-8]|nr:MAG: hypothetical protein B7Z15_08180 [Rhizobiales bacterium 32-66-8]
MGIQPPSDIVFDVMNSADMARSRQVTAKLQALSTGAPAAFDAALASVDEAKASGRKPAPPIQGVMAYAGTTSVGMRNAHALSQRESTTQPSHPAADAFRRFEAMVLSQFVQAMMPDNAAATFGSGTAGETWKSMLADKLSEQVARAGGIGLAARLAAASNAKGEMKAGEAMAAVGGPASPMSSAPSSPTSRA